MASSGTVGTTQLDIAKLIEKTYRRCGIPTGAITPELIDVARENLFLLFNNFSNRGINLWCVDQPLIGLKGHKATYDMPTGTLDILNASYRNISSVTPATTTVGTTTIDWDFGQAQQVVQFGLITTSNYTGVSYTFAGSTDGITFVDLKTVTLANYTLQENYWVSLNTAGNYQYYRLTISTVHTVAAMSVTLVGSYTDLVMQPLNRDDYSALPDKRFEGTPCLQYFYDRLMTPTITLWPVPSVETNCLVFRTHRQIQDVGNSMTATIEVPDRWLDAVSWEHAAMCAVETPTVPQDRIQLCQMQAAQALVNAEAGEVDGSPIFLAPNIGVYTR
jgi:hypothetical protein